MGMESSLVVRAFQDLPCRGWTIHISFHPGIIFARVLYRGTKSIEGSHDDMQLTKSGNNHLFQVRSYILELHHLLIESHVKGNDGAVIIPNCRV